MAKTSTELREEIAELNSTATAMDDRAMVSLFLTAFGMIMTTMVTAMVFFGVYVKQEWGANPPLDIQLMIGTALGIVVFMVINSAGTGWKLVRVYKMRKKAAALAKEAAEAEAEELQILAEQALNAQVVAHRERERERDEAVRRAQEASDAREKQAREAADKPVETLQNPGYKKSERPNKPGGTRT